MKIKRVASYETTDGSIFADKKDAQAHQKQLDRQDALEELVAGAFPHSHQDEAFLDAVTVAQVAQFILDNADEIRAILPQRASPVERITDEELENA